MKVGTMKKILRQQLAELREEERSIDRACESEFRRFRTVSEASAKARHEVAKAILDVQSQLAKL